jgi:magnesium transporter
MAAANQKIRFMPKTSTTREINQQLGALDEALSSGAFQPVRRMLNSLPSAEVAHLLESSPPKLRHALWQLVDIDNEGGVLQFLSEDIQAHFLESMDAEEVVAITEGLDTDDIADILQQLPDTVIREVLQSMDAQDRQRLERVLTYDEDTAGGLMNTDTITVRRNLTVDVVMRYLRRHTEIPEMTDSLIVVSRKDRFQGLLPLRTLLVSDPGALIQDIMTTNVEPIPASMPELEVARLFERHDWVSAPVVDNEGTLVGRITIDDVVDVIRDDAEHSLMSMAGLDEEEDTFAPVLKTTPRRAVWLGINLITALIASAVISMFEATIQQVVALAILMPIVASMGGVAGSQTLTVVIRGIALGQISRNNTRWLVTRELIVGAINGILWAAVVGVAATYWFDDSTIGMIIALAMIINLVTAALAGALLPIGLKAIKIDPALAGSVALTTITDVIGFMAFLGLASLFYT